VTQLQEETLDEILDYADKKHTKVLLGYITVNVQQCSSQWLTHKENFSSKSGLTSSTTGWVLQQLWPNASGSRASCQHTYKRTTTQYKQRTPECVIFSLQSVKVILRSSVSIDWATVPIQALSWGEACVSDRAYLVWVFRVFVTLTSKTSLQRTLNCSSGTACLSAAWSLDV